MHRQERSPVAILRNIFDRKNCQLEPNDDSERKLARQQWKNINIFTSLLGDPNPTYICNTKISLTIKMILQNYSKSLIFLLAVYGWIWDEKSM
jgi:hypothetical protein